MKLKQRQQLIIRCDPELVRQLKVVAAHKNISMNELVRQTLELEILTLRKAQKATDQALKAASL